MRKGVFETYANNEGLDQPAKPPKPSLPAYALTVHFHMTCSAKVAMRRITGLFAFRICTKTQFLLTLYQLYW